MILNNQMFLCLLWFANLLIKVNICWHGCPKYNLPALSTDPAQLKPKLSEYGNKVLREELEKCDVKHKIFICPHSLPKEPQENLYGPPDRRGYDGIHLYGSEGQNHLTEAFG